MFGTSFVELTLYKEWKNCDFWCIFYWEICISFFFANFPETRIRGYADTLSDISQDWMHRFTWNFQGLFLVLIGRGYMKKFFQKLNSCLIISKYHFFRVQTPWQRIFKKKFIYPLAFLHINMCAKSHLSNVTRSSEKPDKVFSPYFTPWLLLPPSLTFGKKKFHKFYC